MPTPNIPDEVVEAARLAYNDGYWDEACEIGIRQAVAAAIPLLLEHVATVSEDGIGFVYPLLSPMRNTEPLYRLKVSNEQ